MPNNLNVGDIVKIVTYTPAKSELDAPEMVVESIESSDKVRCVWYDGASRVYKREDFSVGCLMVIKKTQQPL